MANHLKPNDDTYQDTEEDLLFSCRIMAKTLGLLLRQQGPHSSEKNEGVIVDLDGKRYIVSNNSETDQIDITEESSLKEYEEGTMLWLY